MTANILYPGAFVKPAPLQLSNGEIIRPTHGPVIMEAPIVWLASERSNGTNGKKITAARWKDVAGTGVDGAAIGWPGVER